MAFSVYKQVWDPETKAEDQDEQENMQVPLNVVCYSGALGCSVRFYCVSISFPLSPKWQESRVNDISDIYRKPKGFRDLLPLSSSFFLKLNKSSFH